MAQRQSKISRRNFVKLMGAAGIGSAAIGARADDARAKTETKAPAVADMRVPTRPFGKTGVDVPILSLGGIFNTGQNHVMMRQAFKWGVTYWDTAERYNFWGSEPGIGKYFNRFPGSREKTFLVTKAYTVNAEYLDGLLDQSLKNLQTDYIDLYFLHAVDDVADEMTDEIRRWAEKAKKSGKIRLFGVSFHANMAANLKASAKLGYIDGLMTTYNYRFMVDDEVNRGLDACHKAGIGITAMKTQAVSPRNRNRDMGDQTDAALKLTQKFLDKGFTPHQARMMAVWSDPRIASICSQMENMTILKENVAAAVAGQQLSQGDFRRLSAYADATASSYCTGCASICEAHLTPAVPVCRVMRYLMYARGYGDTDRARRSFGRLPSDVRRAMAVADYAAAEAHCPANMPIGRLMRTALAELG